MSDNPTPADAEQPMTPKPSTEELDELLRALWNRASIHQRQTGRTVDYEIAEAKRRLQSLIDAARKEVIDKVFELSPTAQFKDWKPQDALAFYERLKAYEQELSHPAPVDKSDKE